MRIGSKDFVIGRQTYIMGILNVTPDSFSDGGRYNTMDSVLRAAEKMIEEGAHIIDVGGESSRPGHEPISEEEEIKRVVPVVRELKKRFDVPISIDTCKSAVAKEVLEVGADMINDIWGFRKEKEMASVVAKYGVPVCLMHNRNGSEYGNFVKEVIGDLQESVKIALENGVKKENIILDPGIGFGKTYEQNLLMINVLEELTTFGYPVLLGTSRKSVIGMTLDLPVTEREEGTIATSVIGAMKGCSFVRVHDVEKNARALKMTDTILNAGRK